MPGRAHVIQFGCRLNQYESDSLGSGLQQRGFELSPQIGDSDYVVINTCTVTNRADQKNRNVIRRIHSQNPRAKIVVTGCYATTDPEEIRALPGVFWVIDNSQKANIPQMIEREVRQQPPEPLADNHFGFATREHGGTARAYLKIQEGCNKSCSYCKIPQARGSGKSRDFNETIAEARALIAAGFRELILTGVNMGWYKSLRGENLNDLIEALLNLDGDFILRLSSIEPADVNERLASFFQHEKMAQFLHVPLQSGSKDILKLMRRGYTPAHYRRWVEFALSKNPDLHLGTDVIVGFPGETAAHFDETMRFCEEMAFANIHVFSFSKRNNTPVLQLLAERDDINEVHGSVIKERAADLRHLKDVMAMNYQHATAGQAKRAIVIGNEYVLTENYLKFPLPAAYSNLNHGQLIRVVYSPTALTQIIV